MTPPWAAVILAGGSGRRLGGVDKPGLVVRGRTLLDRAVDACAGADEIVVVGPRRLVAPTVAWAREDPPGSGPLAALEAGLAALVAAPPVVVVLAADLPSISTGLVSRLVGGLPPDVDAALVVDAGGRVQPLVGAYRHDSLRSALAAVGDPRDRPFRAVLEPLTVTTVADPAGAADIDTADDLVRWQTPGDDPTPTDVERDR